MLQISGHTRCPLDVPGTSSDGGGEKPSREKADTVTIKIVVIIAIYHQYQ